LGRRGGRLLRQSPFFYSLTNIVKQFLYLNLAGFRVVAGFIVRETRHLTGTQQNRVVEFGVFAFLAIKPLARFVSTPTVVAVKPTFLHLASTKCRTHRNRVSVSKAGQHTNIFYGGIRLVVF
jgi:hypothetical protein